jgi:hypothetical protein
MAAFDHASKRGGRTRQRRNAVQRRFSRTATALATAIAIVVIGGAAVAGLALAGQGAGLTPTSEFGDPSAGPSGFPTDGPSASPEASLGAEDDNGGDPGDGFCEPGDDCGGLRTPTPSYGDEYGDDRRGSGDARGDNGGSGNGGDDGNSGPGGGGPGDDN